MPRGDNVTPRTVDGRVPGRRAQQTRARYLDCLRDLLRSSRYRDITVTDLARMAGGVPGTFYQYFPDIDAAILALAEETAESGARLRALVREPTADERYPAIERLVDAFLDFWQENEPVLRVIDLAALEGDQRFRLMRVQMLNSVARALVDLSRHSGRSPRPRLDPMAMAGTLVGLLAHVSAHQRGFPAWGIRLDDVRVSVARLVYWGVTGEDPPPPVRRRVAPRKRAAESPQ